MTDKMKKRQEQLELSVLKSKDIDGVEMGVLSDGTAFLTGRGLARLCGVAASGINPWANDYDANSGKRRDETLYRLLQKKGFSGDALFVKIKLEGQSEVNAFPAAVCMAFLEYYAFDSDRKSAEALHNYRTLSDAGLKIFIYNQMGYDPLGRISDPFKSYHDRMLLNRLPNGVFSVFSEIAHVILASIQAGLVVDDHTVPDVSVGMAWAKYWNQKNLEKTYGVRTHYPHTYPPEYPQSAVVPDASTYPIMALGEFRAWLDRDYLPMKYPGYLERKVKAGALPASRAELLLATLVPPQLGDGKE